MTSKDILIELLSLVMAVKDNNIQETQNLVDIINENEEALREIGVSVFDILDPYGLVADGNIHVNDSLLYMINNLKALAPLSEKIQFEINIMLLLQTEDSSKIQQKINELTEEMQNNDLPVYKYVGLIKLTNLIKDYKLLNTIRQKLIEFTRTEVN